MDPWWPAAEVVLCVCGGESSAASGDSGDSGQLNVSEAAEEVEASRESEAWEGMSRVESGVC